MINNDYIIELPQITWERDQLIAYMNSKESLWKDGNTFFKPKELEPVFHSLLEQLKDFNVSLSRSLFGRIAPNDLLAPHIDPARDVGIYFPLIGDWENSPIVFNKTGNGTTSTDAIAYQHVYTVPTIINASEMHYVKNNSNQERITFMLTFVGLSWEDTQAIVKEKYST